MHTALRIPARRRLLGLAAVAVLAVAVGLAGCAKPPRQATGLMDTPENHVSLGNRFLDQNRWSDAENEFNLALQLNKDHGPAMSGLAIVRAHAASQATGKDKERLTDQALDLADKGLSKAKGDDAERAARVAYIRVYTYTQSPSSWLKKAESQWEHAVDLDKRKQDPDPDFFMARAYRAAFEWQKSMDAYSRVLNLKRGREEQANDEMAVVQKIVRAAPGSPYGNLIALQPALDRADVAALLVEELQLTRLYERGNTQRFDTSFQAPTQPGGQMQVDTMQHMPEVTDIANHPMKADIQEIIKLRVDGLEPYPDHTFQPDKKLTRGEFAIMIVDIVSHVTGDAKMKSEYFGESRSSIPDIAPSNPMYSAAKTSLARGFLEPKDRFAGTFGPGDDVSGADALLAIKEVNRYLGGLHK